MFLNGFIRLVTETVHTNNNNHNNLLKELTILLLFTMYYVAKLQNLS